MELRFTPHTLQTAPREAKPSLEKTQENLGMVPNLERVMAEAPPLLQSYVFAWDRFDESSLTPVERQVVYQTANFENNCRYCVPWHTLLSRVVGMDEANVQALREGHPLTDPKLEALRVFARRLIETRGQPSEAELEAFFDAGYTPRQALEVVLGLAVKLMSNFTNSIAETPLDDRVSALAWEKPAAGLAGGAGSDSEKPEAGGSGGGRETPGAGR